ncbi:putative oxidoreductase,short chain dehydrogenase [Hypoxylon crocopeplum]|nr:putative oxidoreductase,short chain dehydrogenase [Hypoxylon crocopeplum]
MVTGASDGVGHALAREFAARGFNLVLHGRNHKKLSRVMSQFQETFPHRSFRILIANATTIACTTYLKAPPNVANPDLAPLDFEAIQRGPGDITLTVLVNNAGGGPVKPVCLSLKESPEIRITENVSLNVLFLIHMTRALLPNLMRHAPSLVINISSMVDQGFPLLASYSASKSFIMTITRALCLEMGIEGLGNNVEILGVRVGRVTGTSRCEEPASLFVPNAETIAEAQIGVFLLAMLPGRVRDNVIISVMRQERESLDGDIKTMKQS